MSKYKGAFQVVEPVEEEQAEELSNDYPEVEAPGETEPEDAPHLTQNLYELSVEVGELDTQLRQIIRVNRALEEDLARSRKRVKYLTGERERLVMEIEDMQHEARSVEDMQAEVEQLHRERNTLAGKSQNLSRALAKSEERVLEIVQLLDKFRAERDGASQEAVCLDAQFSRAMKVIGELRTERDSLKSDLAESRRALEEIRESILDASREQQ
jgi:uncharacterized coiled-coil DUF342 family protein